MFAYARREIGILATATLVLAYTSPVPAAELPSPGQPPLQGQASFQGLGDLPGGSFFSGGSGVSADGTVAVGGSITGAGVGAFRWTGGVISPLGDLPGGSFSSSARAVSADGSVIVGRGQSDLGSEAFYWTAADGMQPIRMDPDTRVTFSASGVSPDGSIIVGQALSGEAFRYADGTLTMLGDLPGGSPFSEAKAVSPDGSIIVGRGNADEGAAEAVIWTDGVIDSLGDLPGGLLNSEAWELTPDKATIVGFATSELGTEAVRWDRQAEAATGDWSLTPLGDLPGGSYASEARAVSDDGSIIVGESSNADGSRAFLWTAADGMRSLKDVLETDFGLDLTGWRLEDANDVSADGLTIVGTGFENGVGRQAFIATLPEPSTGVVLLVGVLLMTIRSGRG